jgi:hypothetical protein
VSTILGYILPQWSFLVGHPAKNSAKHWKSASWSLDETHSCISFLSLDGPLAPAKGSNTWITFETMSHMYKAHPSSRIAGAKYFEKEDA